MFDPMLSIHLPICFTKYDRTLLEGLGPIGAGFIFCIFGILNLYGAKLLKEEKRKRSHRQALFLKVAAVFMFLFAIFCFGLRIVSGDIF